jgi:hypothetical protein
LLLLCPTPADYEGIGGVYIRTWDLQGFERRLPMLEITAEKRAFGLCQVVHSSVWNERL